MSGESIGQSGKNACRRYRPALWIGAGVAVVLGCASIWFLREPAEAASQKNAGNGPVVVQTARASRGNVPVYLEGLGTVQAFYTVTITPRVSGELQQVYFGEGEHVRKGQLLAQIDPRPYQAALDQATATESKDEAQLAIAKRNLARYMELAPHNLTSKQTVDEQRAQVAELTAQLAIDKAQIDNARTQLGYTRITSPIDGRTGIRQIDPGNNVLNTDGKGIVVVTQMQPISVVFTLPESSLGQISQAMAYGKVSVAALSQGGATLDTGTLTVVDNQIDTSTGTMRLKAIFPNPRSTLWPGQFVNVRVLAATQQGVVTVPTVSIQNGPDGSFIYVVKQDSTVEARPVKLGEQDGDRTVISSGLAVGERVVTSNQFRLEPGAHVQFGS